MKVWFVPLWLLYMTGLGAIYLTIPVSPDQALFDYIAWSHLQGDLYYGGAAEQNFPGKMLMHEAAVRLFGPTFWAFRAFDFLVMAAITLGGAAFLRRAGFGAVGAAAFMGLYPFLYITSGPWMAGQRDLVAAGLLLVAAAVLPVPTRQNAALAAFAAGLIVAAAVLIRPTYLSYLAGLIALVWIRFPGEDRAGFAQKAGQSFALLAGFCALIGAVVWAGARLGVLDDFYLQAIRFNFEIYQDQESRWRLAWLLRWHIGLSWHWIAALAAGGLVAWIALPGRLRSLVLVIGLAATVLLSYVVQNKGFLYHFGGLLTVFTLLGAALIGSLWIWLRGNRGIRRMLAAVTLALVSGLVLLGAYSKISGYAPNIATLAQGRFEPLVAEPGQPSWEMIADSVRILRADDDPHGYVLQWGRNFQIPFLAERRSTLRFLSSPALEVITPSFSGYEDWMEEIQRDLVVKAPRFVIIETPAIRRDEAGRLVPRPEASLAERRVIATVSDYDTVQSTPFYEILKTP